MDCPECHSPTTVIDSRRIDGQTRRRRRCEACGTFSTLEIVVTKMKEQSVNRPDKANPMKELSLLQKLVAKGIL